MMPAALRHDLLRRLHDDIARIEAIARGVSASWNVDS
jgi:hypothetical protein